MYASSCKRDIMLHNSKAGKQAWPVGLIIDSTSTKYLDLPDWSLYIFAVHCFDCKTIYPMLRQTHKSLNHLMAS